MITLLAKTENEKYHDTFISDKFGMKQIQYIKGGRHVSARTNNFKRLLVAITR